VTKFIPLIAAITPALAVPAGADEITDQLDRVRRGVRFLGVAQGHPHTLVRGCRHHEKINRDLLKLLPEPREGWQADEPQVRFTGMATMIAGTNLSRRYSRADGAEVEIGITADSPLMPMMSMLLSNPMLIQLPPDTKPYAHAGQHGVSKRHGRRQVGD